MRSISTALAALLTAALTLSQAAGPSIGWITARGSFELDGVRTAGNATLFEGSRVETRAANAQLSLSAGAKLELAPGSACRVYSGYVKLDRGQGQLARNGAYQVETLGLRIHPERAGALARVSLRDDQTVHVAAVGGPVLVVRPGVATVAQVLPGKALALQPQAADSNVTTLTGVVRKVEDRYLLTDKTANVTVELVGQDLEKYVGQRVQVSGTIDLAAQPAAGAAEALKVVTISVSAAATGAVAGAAAAGTVKAVLPTVAGVSMVGGAMGYGIVSTKSEPDQISR